MVDEAAAEERRLRRACTEQLESLRRAGLTHLAKHRPQHKAAARTAADSPPLEAIGCGAAPAAMGPGSPEPGGARGADSLELISREISACTRCAELASTRTKTVPGVGPAHPRLLFLGEAPGADEDRQGEPFVGRAGQLLTRIIEDGMGLKRSDVFITNVLKCRPPGNRTPKPEEAANCREYLDRQLELIRPEFICCLGAVAVQNLLGTDRPIGRLRGQFFEYRTIRVMCTYHPAYLLRNPAAKKDTWADIQILLEAMGLPVPTRGGKS